MCAPFICKAIFVFFSGLICRRNILFSSFLPAVIKQNEEQRDGGEERLRERHGQPRARNAQKIRQDQQQCQEAERFAVDDNVGAPGIPRRIEIGGGDALKADEQKASNKQRQDVPHLRGDRVGRAEHF